MQVFIVHAHPEPKSFNGALTNHARQVLCQEGHEVVVSDLYAMDWQPCSDRSNFVTQADPEYFKQQDEEALASKSAGFATPIQEELDKLFGCDVLIFQFPLWWFSMPAILKGWVDRVFAMGTVYGSGHWYDLGHLAGRRAMLSVTVGGSRTMYAPDGINGDINMLLYPIQHGILRFAGFDVLPPFITWEPARISLADRRAYLDTYRDRLKTLQSDEPIAFPSVADYDPQTLRLHDNASLAKV